MRVHELAKEYSVSAKDLLTKLQEAHVDAKNNMSALDKESEIVARRLAMTLPKLAPPPPPVVKKPIVVAAVVAKPLPPAPAPVVAPEPPKAEPVAPAVTVAPAPVETKPAAPVEAKPAVPVETKPTAPVAEPPKASIPADPPPAAAEATVLPPSEPNADESEPKNAAKETKKASSRQDVTPDITVFGNVIKTKGPIIVKDLAHCLGARPNKLIAELMGMNVLASINEKLDITIARKLAERHGFTLEHEKKTHEHVPLRSARDATGEEIDQPEDLHPRPPIVTFLGHVDHGKTSLLDKIRNASVAKGEHGGITQHIGAYTVEVSGRTITFLDTPGHAAFTAMRARGANLTDIAVIIVDSVDGVMPQTKEAIRHAKAAEVSIMVALNKIDLPTANPERAMQQLQAEGLAPEEWGGDVIFCRVSAITGEGIPHLLDMLLLQADVLELKANPKRRAQGFVVEAQMQPGMGPTVNVLITSGTLNVGDTILCGRFWGRVRALINDHGNKVKSAAPGIPVRCLGLPGVPAAGAEFKVMPNDRMARELAEAEAAKIVREQIVIPRKASLETLFERLKDSDRLELAVIIKADTQGSIEAITHALREIKCDKVALNILLGTAGNITTNDIMLASASDAIILGFHVDKEPGVESTAKREGVEIRMHQIIYNLIDEVEKGMTGLLEPIIRQKVVGSASVKQVFTVGKGTKIAGCQMMSGFATSKSKARVLRNKEVQFEGSIEQIRHFQDIVTEIKEPQECGIRLSRYSEFVEGDTLEFYEIEEIQQTL